VFRICLYCVPGPNLYARSMVLTFGIFFFNSISWQNLPGLVTESIFSFQVTLNYQKNQVQTHFRVQVQLI
jgi:hypothetical protein